MALPLSAMLLQLQLAPPLPRRPQWLATALPLAWPKQLPDSTAALPDALLHHQSLSSLIRATNRLRETRAARFGQPWDGYWLALARTVANASTAAHDAHVASHFHAETAQSPMYRLRCAIWSDCPGQQLATDPLSALLRVLSLRFELMTVCPHSTQHLWNLVDPSDVLVTAFDVKDGECTSAKAGPSSRN